MKNKKFKGFSLAELLISLLIISIVLSAAIPTLTKRAGAGREFIWRWSQQQNNNAYFGVGGNQSAIIGAETIPLKGENLNNIFVDDEIDKSNFKFSNNGDKLVLVKRIVDLGTGTGEYDFANSHISFYNAKNSSKDATTSDITYTGRIATNLHDLAFGIGTLQSLDEDDSTNKKLGHRNTALGHYTLLKNTTGVENTAVGEKALSYNGTGSYNTAVGFKSLFNAGYSQDGGTANETSSNTAIGFQAARDIRSGSGNSIIGAKSMLENTQGNENVVFGYESLMKMTNGSQNVVLGANACNAISKGDNNICIGYKTGATSKKDASGNPMPEPSNYGIFIGSSNDNSMPIISGHSQKIDSFEKEIDINARTFKVQPHNAGDFTFRIDSYAATNLSDFDSFTNTVPGKGYGTGAQGYKGDVTFTLLSGGADTVSLSLTGTRGTTTEKYPRAVIGSYDNRSKKKLNLSFNELSAFIYKDSANHSDTTCKGNVCLNAIEAATELGLNKKILISNEAATPNLSLSPSNINVTSGNNTDYAIIFQSPSGTGSIKFDLGGNFNKITISNKDNKNIFISSESGGKINSENFSLDDKTVYFKKLLNQNVEIPNESGGQYNYTLKGNLLQDLQGICHEITTHVKELASKVSAQYSDARLKDILGDNTAGLKEINALEVKNFTYKADKNKTPHVGVIAQQLQKVFPNSVFKDEDGYLRMTKDEIFYAMVNSIKELFKQIQDLTAKITGLDKRITELEKQNAQLKKQNAEFEKRLSKLEKTSR